MKRTLNATTGIVACCFIATAAAQLKPIENYDKECMTQAGKDYISCMATAKTEPAKQKCQENKADTEQKQCKKKK